MIKMFQVRTAKDAGKRVEETLQSGMIGEGPRVAEFKERLQERFGNDKLILLNSGTSALTLALRLSGVGVGDEVITTPFTMIATNVAICAAGGTPVFADIEEKSMSISADSIREKITKKTKAIIIVLVGGIPPDLEKIELIAVNAGIPLIIDAAHGIDTYYKGDHISWYGDYVCFSFQSIKQLHTGDGGALVVNDEENYRRAEKLKWFGMTRIVPEGMTRLEHQMTADVEEWGYKMHMNDIAASIGLANLPGLGSTTFKQVENAEFYLKELKEFVGLPELLPGGQSSWWAFYIFVENRKEFMEKMLEAGIETTPMWRRNDEYSCFKKADLPNMTKLQDKVVFIPVGWWLSLKERRYIVENIIRIVTA